MRAGETRESVWDYPRPPRVEASGARVRVTFGGVLVADTTSSLRVLETSHPPVYYIPRDDVAMDCLQPTDHRTFCEWKGEASYFTLRVGDRLSENAAWTYPNPGARYSELMGAIAFYPGRVDECTVDGERVRPQASPFYGGWITDAIEGAR